MTKDSVAIIVLNHNKRDDLLECIGSIYRQNYDNYNIVVVDNASTDGSASAVRAQFPEINIIESRINIGAVEGRNVGKEFADKNFDYNYLLFLDDDSVIDKNFITNLISVFDKDPHVGIAAGKAFTNDKLEIIMSAGIRANLYTGSIYDIGSGQKDNGQFNSSGYVDACGGFGIMIRRSLFSSLGGFDINYSPYGWEDVDLCIRAKSLGYSTYYSSEAIIVHKGTKLGRKPNPVYEKNKIKNYIYLLKTNTSAFQKLSCAFFLPFRAANLSAKLIYNGNGKIILEHFKGLFIGINNIRVSLKSK